MPNYALQRQKSRLIYSTSLAVTDRHTAAPGFRREARFDRVLQTWISGYQHTVPQVLAWLRVDYYLSQN